MRTVPPGIVTTKRFHPTSRDSAAAVGNAGVEAVATIAMILWIEATCGELMVPYLEPGEAGVGTRVAVDHTGPAFAGRPVDVHARVTGVDGRKVSFTVRLEQGGREVMTGEHVRAVVDLERFLRGSAENAGTAANRSAASGRLPPIHSSASSSTFPTTSRTEPRPSNDEVPRAFRRTRHLPALPRRRRRELGARPLPSGGRCG